MGTDETGTIKIQVWDDQSQKIQAQKFYTITHLSTRHFAGQSLLMMTPQSAFTEIQNIALPNNHEDINLDQNITNLMGQPVAADIKYKLRCSICNKLQLGNSNPKDKYRRCNNCDRKQKTSMFNKNLSGTLSLKETVGRIKDYKINGATLIKLLQQNKMELKENPDEIEELILDMSHVKCVVGNDESCTYKDRILDACFRGFT